MPRGYPGTHQGHGTLSRYRTGCQCSPCREANRRYAILRELDPNPRRVNSTPTARKLQALWAIGWAGPVLGQHLGVGKARVGHLSRAMYPTVTRTIHAQVDELYRELCMKVPPTRTPTERHSYLRAKTTARKNGWVPPLAWDDIDDLTEKPDRKLIAKKAPRTYRVDTDEWVYLVRGGENPERAAERLGVHIDAVEMAFRRAEDVTTWHRYRRTT